MPHSLFLGSDMVQSRLNHFDVREGNAPPLAVLDNVREDKYRPSASAIRSCLKYSAFELAITLFTFALFINSAILIVAGSSLDGKAFVTGGDLFGIHDLLSQQLAPVAGTIFALALLLSGTSASIVCTIAGQIVAEGMLNWTLPPWARRLFTRSIAITPSIIIAGGVGRGGLNRALVASQIVLSIILPFVVGPLIYFCARSHIMSVSVEGTADRAGDDSEAAAGASVDMANGWVMTIVSGLLWLLLVVMNMALLVLIGLGKA